MNLSVHIPTKKSKETDEPSSPIKTNGFGEARSASFRNNEIFTKTDGFNKVLRNYGALRQPKRPTAF